MAGTTYRPSCDRDWDVLAQGLYVIAESPFEMTAWLCKACWAKIALKNSQKETNR